MGTYTFGTTGAGTSSSDSDSLGSKSTETANITGENEKCGFGNRKRDVQTQKVRKEIHQCMTQRSKRIEEPSHRYAGCV